ncbi:MAG: right-handed parallel beta-helix repeat-containing protein, partial [Clostridia bacterium]|nr:right-handed parallel beta-helix repeat-containing protein [Clostridia bacterium]
WWHNIVHASGVDYDDYVIDTNGDKHVAVYIEADEYAKFFIHGSYSMVGRYVFMKNALAYVDNENEYYYDENEGKVYYCSETNPSDKSFARGTHDYMFVFHSVKNVTLSDLRITGVDDAYLSHNDGCISLDNMGGTGMSYTQTSTIPVFDRGAIVLDSAYDVTIVGCTFEELGARAIFGRNILKNIVVESNQFIRLGSGALHFGDGTNQRTWQAGRSEFENIEISNNYVYDVAREYYSSVAIWVSFGRNLSVLNNTVEKCSYTAIGIGFTYGIPGFNPGDFGDPYHLTNVEVAYNFTSGFMHEIGDGGGIYLSGGSAKKDYLGYFNFVHDNYILFTNQTGNGLGHMLVGIYFDGSASNWKCYDNVVVEQSYGAASGEDDELYREGDSYVVAMRKRRAGTTFIYLQHIASQITHNILCDNNYILNVRAKTPEAQKEEVYKTYVEVTRNLYEQNTHYVTDMDRIPIAAEEIIYAAGSYGHEGDPSVLWNNDY